MKDTQQSLPISTVLTDISTHLAARRELVIEAPPGAGKTTLVPLSLLGEPWLGSQKILVLEPRRLAARAASHRMAELLGEIPGQTIGHRMRLDTNVGADTRVEVITEGVFTRMLQNDPSLDGVGVVIFDEYHERSLDADLGLSFCLQARSLFREEDPLRIVVMSATLDTGNIAALLGDAPVVRSKGRRYPVQTHYARGRPSRVNLIDTVCATTMAALGEHPDSSILVFLPGQGEITRVAEHLAEKLRKDRRTRLFPLYGNLSIEDQRAAIAPLTTTGERKVVLATNIAETSLTIEGIDVVVDSGLVREPVFDPNTGMTRLQTRNISQASSIQREGRAGRLRPGYCYRLWSADAQGQLAPHATPEILQADLAPLALQLFRWGVQHPSELTWQDAPPPGPWAQAIDLLTELGAISGPPNKRALTKHGEAISGLSMHPRLGHMLICGAAAGQADDAARLAAFLSERDPMGNTSVDVETRLMFLRGDAPVPGRFRGWASRLQQLVRQYKNELPPISPADLTPLPQSQVTGYLLACAYPDRIARRRYAGGFQLANGRSALLPEGDNLGGANWLAIAEVSSSDRARHDTIRSAATLDPELFDSALKASTSPQTVAEWDQKARRFLAEERRAIGKLVLSRTKLDRVPLEAKLAALTALIRRDGFSIMSFDNTLQQWRARVDLVRQSYPAFTLPDLSDVHLLETLEEWLAPYLNQVSHIDHFRKLDVASILRGKLDYEQQQLVDRYAPKHLTVPSGSAVTINYLSSPPVLAVKLQEMFGFEETPAICDGKVPLLIHLLSPAGRPLQVTQDLASFWRNGYSSVRSEMKGRYPKHPWPIDPTTAQPTRHTKRRSQAPSKRT